MRLRSAGGDRDGRYFGVILNSNKVDLQLTIRNHDAGERQRNRHVASHGGNNIIVIKNQSAFNPHVEYSVARVLPVDLSKMKNDVVLPVRNVELITEISVSLRLVERIVIGVVDRIAGVIGSA